MARFPLSPLTPLGSNGSPIRFRPFSTTATDAPIVRPLGARPHRRRNTLRHKVLADLGTGRKGDNGRKRTGQSVPQHVSRTLIEVAEAQSNPGSYPRCPSQQSGGKCRAYHHLTLADVRTCDRRNQRHDHRYRVHRPHYRAIRRYRNDFHDRFADADHRDRAFRIRRYRTGHRHHVGGHQQRIAVYLPRRSRIEQHQPQPGVDRGRHDGHSHGVGPHRSHGSQFRCDSGDLVHCRFRHSDHRCRPGGHRNRLRDGYRTGRHQQPGDLRLCRRSDHHLHFPDRRPHLGWEQRHDHRHRVHRPVDRPVRHYRNNFHRELANADHCRRARSCGRHGAGHRHRFGRHQQRGRLHLRRSAQHTGHLVHRRLRHPDHRRRPRPRGRHGPRHRHHPRRNQQRRPVHLRRPPRSPSTPPPRSPPSPPPTRPARSSSPSPPQAEPATASPTPTSPYRSSPQSLPARGRSPAERRSFSPGPI